MAAQLPQVEGYGSPSVSKDEVGWMFVRKFYTILNQNPNDLHKFYSKQSSLSYGLEGEIAQTFVGQRAIHEKITSLQFHECLVLISSVDTLASLNGGIIIQVLGELSNHKAPSAKFAQTFFLAEQRTGYFVLNDIFRYIKEEVESDFDEAEPDSAIETEQPTDGLSNGIHSASHSIATEEEATTKPAPLQFSSAPVETLNESQPIGKSSTEDIHPADAPSEEADISVETVPHEHIHHEEVTSNDRQVTEDEPAPPLSSSGHATPIDQGTHTPAETSAPSETQTSHAPKTWATLAASNAEKWHAHPEPKASTGTTAGQPKVNGTQTIPRKEATRPAHQEKPEPALGYIKHVGPKIQKSMLNDALVKYGQLKDLDINRQKSCGFVEFASQSALQAAIAAGPIDLGENTRIVVEERRKTNKVGDAKSGKPLTTDRRVTSKGDENRTTAAKKVARGAAGTGMHKVRGE